MGYCMQFLAVAKDGDIVTGVPVSIYTFGVNFASQEDKNAFLYRLGEARRILKQHTSLLSAMLDLVLATPSPATSTSSFMEQPVHTM